MGIRKQQYIFTWIALISIITAATVLLLIPSFVSLSAGMRTLIAFIAWGLTVVPAIFLFLAGSRGTLAKMIRTKEVPESDTDTPLNRSLVSGQKETMNIQSVAGKITRRTDPRQPPGQWGRELINMLVSEIEIMSGLFFYRDQQDTFTALATYAFPHNEAPRRFVEGEGLNGQVAKNGQVQVIRNIPDHYATVFSGLGSGKPAYLAIIPLVANEHTLAVIEVAGFRWSDDNLEQLFHVIARTLSEKIQAADQEQKL
ncbi:MAG: GAF domain-containing protein [Bacteroidales bacterium]|nr:GAF domain-containing protein [Bacteroidales bacterium]